MLPRNPASGRTVALLTAALAVLLVGLFMLGGQLIDEPAPVRAVADEPVTAPPSPTSAPPSPNSEVTPSRNPRLEPDVDRGKAVGQGIFVEVADGWTQRAYSNNLEVTSWDRGAAGSVWLSLRPVPSLPLMRTDASAFADTQQIYGFRAGRARVLPPPNRNIVEATSLAFTGRRRDDGVTYSLAGERVRLRGRPETNDVSISFCWAAHVQDLGTVRPEVEGMIASAARSV
jgi:hypothetical protein